MNFFRNFRSLNFIKNESMKDLFKLSIKHKSNFYKVGILTVMSSSMFMILPLGFKEIQKLSKRDKNETHEEIKQKYYIFSSKIFCYLILLGIISRKRLIACKEFEDIVLMDLRKKMFSSKILKLGNIYKDHKISHSSSTLITKNINDAYNITLTLSEIYFRFIRGITFGLGGIGIMIYSFPSLFGFTTIGVLILSLINKKMSKKIQTVSNLQIQKIAEKSNFMGSIYGNTKLIDSNKLFIYCFTKYNELLKENHKLILEFTRHRANYIMLLEIFGISYFMSLITYGTYLISIGSIPAENLSLSLYTIYGISGFRGILGAIADIKEKLGIYDDLKDLIKDNTLEDYNNFDKKENLKYFELVKKYLEKIDKNDLKNNYEKILNYENHEFEFIENEIIKLQNNINNINIDVKFNIGEEEKNIKMNLINNDKIGIIGNSGCGKSTFLDIFKGIYNYEKQEKIEFYDQNNNQINKDKINIYYGFQDHMLIRATLIDNILLGNHNFIEKLIKIQKENNLSDSIITKFIIKKVLISLKKVQLYNKIVNREFGLLEQFEEQGENFSGGEKQRLNLSRLFIDKPDIILLDESTSNLDRYTEDLIIKELKFFLENKIVICISHNKEFLNKFTNKEIYI